MDLITLSAVVVVGIICVSLLGAILYFEVADAERAARHAAARAATPVPSAPPLSAPTAPPGVATFVPSHHRTTTDEIKGTGQVSDRSISTFTPTLGRISKSQESAIVKHGFAATQHFAAASSSAGAAEAIWIKTAESDPLIEADYLVSGDPYAVIYGEYGRLGTPRNGVFGPAPRLNTSSGYV